MSSTENSNKPYIHWIHCNRCHEQFIQKKRKFFLLACQHVTCQACLIEIKQDVNGPKAYKCPVCQKTTRSSEISNTMPKNLKELFHPEPYLDGLNSFQIIKFQAGHRRRFLEYLDRQRIMTMEEERTTEKFKELCKKTYQDNNQRKIERKQMEKRVLAIKQQRRELDDNSHNKSNSMPSSSSSATSSNKSRKVQASPGRKARAITTFSELTPQNSFLL